jgi:hypothetical protein
MYITRKNGERLGVYLPVTYDRGKEVSRKGYVKKIITTATGIKTFKEEKKEKNTILLKQLLFRPTLRSNKLIFFNPLHSYPTY